VGGGWGERERQATLAYEKLIADRRFRKWESSSRLYSIIKKGTSITGMILQLQTYTRHNGSSTVVIINVTVVF
jgi:hypothetical protein